MKTFSPPIDSTDLARINEMQKEGKDKSDPNRYAREYMEAVMKNMFHDPSKISQFRSDYYTLPNEMPENVFFQIGCIFNSLGEWDWRAKLKTLTIPVLTCYGESERQTEAFHEWVGFLPNARLLFIPRAGHFPFVENRDVLITAIERFLSGEWPESAESIEIENLEISDKL